MDLRQFDMPRYLSVLPLFAALQPAELLRLAQGCMLQRYARGEAVYRTGEPCEAFHVVVTGQVKLHAIAPSGQEKVIELVGPGNSFGEALVFTDKPCVVNASAVTDSLLLGVRKETMFGEIAREPRFALRMLAGMSRRLHGLIHDVESYSLHSGLQRVIGYLLREQSGSDGGEGVSTVSLPVSKATIASRLSITPEYFSRVLGELESAELIEVDKRHIRILDAQRLARHPMQ
ncbi:Crp/Fnr family transcriptional regulator [Azohydromonas aeria]|uniref:Crp/Fnr family transcriptional regulator n=1 Tax=Azohydromonas aeria TaxID=2590212 RepID=UPI0012F8A156|nr:Crp/Fnr family transcriptional regulator [Azohydromonas aeria]